MPIMISVRLGIDGVFHVVWGRSEEAPRTEKSETFLIMKDSEFG